MTVTGPSFIALQVRDLERSAQFYETYLGLRRAPASAAECCGLCNRAHPLRRTRAAARGKP